MKTTGQHTCSNKGGREFVLQHAPFISFYLNGEKKRPFLGTGFYFWDDNLPMAEAWGRSHYREGFCILTADMSFKDNDLFDIVGNRKHLMKLSILRQKFKEHKFARDGWELGKFIEFLKDLENQEGYQGVFPFKAIRAVDSSAKARKRFFFVKEKENFTNLDPRYMICIISLDDIHLQRKTLNCY